MTSKFYHLVELKFLPASKQSKSKLYVAVTCIWILSSCCMVMQLMRGEDNSNVC